MKKHIQVIVDGVVKFDHQAETVQFNPVLNRDGQTPCEMQIFVRYGRRRDDGTVEVFS